MQIQIIFLSFSGGNISTLSTLHTYIYISASTILHIYNPQYALFSPVCMGVLGTIKMSTYGLMNDHKHGNVQLL